MTAAAACDRLTAVLSRPDAEIDLAEAALAVASAAYPDLDVQAYRERLRVLGEVLRRRLRPDISTGDAIVALNRYLFGECGFAGNAQDYYDPRNSYLNDVLDRKVGIPITLAVVYMDVGRRIGLALEGVSFPGHFLVKCPLRDGVVILDPYAGGSSLGIADLQERLRGLYGGVPPSESAVLTMLAPAPPHEIVARMLRNLKGIYTHRQEWDKVLPVLGQILAVSPDAADEYRDRAQCYQRLECFRAALADFETYRSLRPTAADGREVDSRIAELRRAAARLN